MKKTILYTLIFCFILTSFFNIHRLSVVEAATTPTNSSAITGVTLASATQNADKTWVWSFKIVAMYLNTVQITLTKSVNGVVADKVTITPDSDNYTTTGPSFQLLDKTSYTFEWKASVVYSGTTDIATMTATYTCTTGNTASCVAVINNSYPQTVLPLASQQDTSTNSTNQPYNLLVPIGNITQAPTNLGDYFNMIFLIAIGLCAVLAVVMIIIGGIQYMGDESIFGKNEAKSKITSAILGLLIALGAYALLNTLNPALLGGNGVNISQATATIDDFPLSSESTVPAPGTATGSSCPGGLAPVIVNGTTIMNTCATISSQVAALLTKAAAAGIALTGKSYRSNADQVALRAKNCATPTTPPSQCTPPTAMPGTSLHESGLAIDFKCNGVSIQTTDNACFIWLQANAGPLLLNYPPEPWHWSTTGH